MDTASIEVLDGAESAMSVRCEFDVDVGARGRGGRQREFNVPGVIKVGEGGGTWAVGVQRVC